MQGGHEDTLPVYLYGVYAIIYLLFLSSRYIHLFTKNVSDVWVLASLHHRKEAIWDVLAADGVADGAVLDVLLRTIVHVQRAWFRRRDVGRWLRADDVCMRGPKS